MRPACAAAAAGLFVLTAASASAEGDACASFKWPVARELQAFSGDLPAVGTGTAYPKPGMAVGLALSAQDAVAYAVRPKRAPKSSPAYGAELTGTIVQPGRYQVTLSEDAWIDLVQGGKALRAIDFSGKKGCPGVRKSVRFDLAAGPVAIAISDAPTAAIKLDLLPAE